MVHEMIDAIRLWFEIAPVMAVTHFAALAILFVAGIWNYTKDRE
jgi:hypothetical protein